VQKFVRQLITEWRRLELSAVGVVVIGVSGGADSSALLAALAELNGRKKLDVEIVAAHFNHKLRAAESDADEAFVRDLADRLGAKFVRGQGKLTGKSDLEQQARNARYAFLAGVAEKEKAPLVLTAHTVNDQAETFLLNLIRGSGPDGLSAMPAIRPISNENATHSALRAPHSGVLLARPLLRWAMRADTEAFCNENGIKYHRDRMNDEPRFTRVRVRKEILPKLAELNPKIVETLARTARLLSEPGATATGSPDDRPSGFSAPAPTVQDNSELTIKTLRALERPDLYRTLREWLRYRRGDLRGITLKHVVAIETLIHSKKSGRTAELPRSGRVVKKGGQIRFEQG